MTVRDRNERPLAKFLQREGDGWGVNVWSGAFNGIAGESRRYIYKTYAEARNGDISHEIGKHGRIS